MWEAAIRWAGAHYWEMLLAVMVAAFFVVLWRLHESDDTNFRFEQFFTDENGAASPRRLFGFGAFGVHSWITARYGTYTPLNDYALSLVSSYAVLWAGVLMLGKGVERLLDAVATILAAKFGVRIETPLGGKDGRSDSETR